MKKPDWNSLFEQALKEPGVILEAYSVFHEYSLANVLLAATQLAERGLPLSPIASYKKWQSLGRQVKKGEKAISLVMPVTIKSKSTDEDEEDGGEQTKDFSKRIFVMRNNWFALSQTDGADYAQEVVTPNWDKARALSQLKIEEVPYESMDGNAQGHAFPNRKAFAVNPLAVLPWKTTFHEMAHCLMHSSDALMADGEKLNMCIKEAEAESVAYLCCASLGLPGLEQSRAYIQGWLGSKEQSEEFRKKSAARVFAAANKILKAGTESVEAEEVANG